jgi:hypothetical protein
MFILNGRNVGDKGGEKKEENLSNLNKQTNLVGVWTNGRTKQLH